MLPVNKLHRFKIIADVFFDLNAVAQQFVHVLIILVQLAVVIICLCPKLVQRFGDQWRSVTPAL